MADWLTPSDVGALPDMGGADVDGNTVLAMATAAAKRFVERKRPEFDTGTAEGYVPDADVKYGAAMLGARFYQRRGSLLGAGGFSEFGASEILRQDPDIARLLGLGTYAAFDFGAPTS